VLIACGAHSAKLVHTLTGKRVPLDTERGYHLMLPNEQQRLPFAVTSLERKFIMTPMAGGLRLAGTVEFAGLDAPPSMQRAWQLHRLSKGLFRAS
jgi:D-amino-acid dehydrogenase